MIKSDDLSMNTVYDSNTILRSLFDIRHINLENAIVDYNNFIKYNNYDKACVVHTQFLNKYKKVLCNNYKDFWCAIMSYYPENCTHKIAYTYWVFFAACIYSDDSLATYFIEHCPQFCEDCWVCLDETHVLNVFIKEYLTNKGIHV